MGKLLNKGFSLIELLTIIGILIVLSGIAITRFTGLKETAQSSLDQSQQALDETYCSKESFTAEQKKLCFCEKGLGELVGLNPGDCCPIGKQKDSSGNCVLFVAKAPPTPLDPPNDPPNDDPPNSYDGVPIGNLPCDPVNGPRKTCDPGETYSLCQIHESENPFDREQFYQCNGHYPAQCPDGEIPDYRYDYKSCAIFPR